MNKIILSQDLRWAKLKADPTCRQCGITKTIADFPRRAVDYACDMCRRDYAKHLYRKKVASLTPDELSTYRDMVNERQNRRRVKFLAALPPDQLVAWRLELNSGNAKTRNAVKEQVYLAYGGYVCACCGETEKLFLSIDHIANDGAAHKREFKLRTSTEVYFWLRKMNFPPGFQVLCMNCQWGKRNNNGICPHQVRCNDHPERE